MSTELMHGKENRPKRMTRNPCAVCGWSKWMGIHSLITNGPRKGQVWDHAYQEPAETKIPKGEAQ